jgi:NAD(P)-dependent dehydrogenase (short-subunit alcohol dehydrogenase family)
MEAPGSEQEMSDRPDHGEQSYRGSGKLDGRAAIITGGDSGIGRAVAIAFAREGSDVAIGYLSEKGDEDASETVRLVQEAGRRAIAHRFNVQLRAECANFVERVVKEFSSWRGRFGRTSWGTFTWCSRRCLT